MTMRQSAIVQHAVLGEPGTVRLLKHSRNRSVASGGGVAWAGILASSRAVNQMQRNIFRPRAHCDSAHSQSRPWTSRLRSRPNSSEILPKSLIAAAVEFGFVRLLRITPRGDALDTAPAVAVYRFSGFVLDLARGALLTRTGEEIPLRRKTFRLLQLLVENAGQLLDRDTIYQAIWADLEVSDDSITQCIHEI